MTKFKPLLAVACEDLQAVKYPVYASVKCDGIRAIVRDGVVYSRSMKPIPSQVVQEKFGKKEYEGFDGELIYGGLFEPDVFNKSTSFCMSKKVPSELDADEIKFYVFDRVGDFEYKERLNDLSAYMECIEHKDVALLDQLVVHNEEEVKEFEQRLLSKGAEGVMLRSLDGKYKQGRSTLKEGILLKRKLFTDAECRVIGFEEKMHNTNEAKKDELGYTERSTSKEGLVPAGTLGALVVHSDEWAEFKIGTGFDDAKRKEIWDHREEWIGKLVKFKYFETGIKNKPRFPTFISERAEFDVSS